MAWIYWNGVLLWWVPTVGRHGGGSNFEYRYLTDFIHAWRGSTGTAFCFGGCRPLVGTGADPI
ncbi:hypothetical protein, partial [Stenotrophomonas sp. ZAC14D1_NAIMI4_1]|uniref:hypothetical protein n=1 Tax=Stenotrophomonas sp. ZAC14D1_NAIMI4_1 TaxID=2072411 RepID=UPI001C1FBE71